MAQGVAYHCSKVECEDHSAIQAPKARHQVSSKVLDKLLYNKVYKYGPM